MAHLSSADRSSTTSISGLSGIRIHVLMDSRRLMEEILLYPTSDLMLAWVPSRSVMTATGTLQTFVTSLVMKSRLASREV